MDQICLIMLPNLNLLSQNSSLSYQKEHRAYLDKLLIKLIAPIKSHLAVSLVNQVVYLAIQTQNQVLHYLETTAMLPLILESPEPLYLIAKMETYLAVKKRKKNPKKTPNLMKRRAQMAYTQMKMNFHPSLYKTLRPKSLHLPKHLKKKYPSLSKPLP